MKRYVHYLLFAALLMGVHSNCSVARGTFAVKGLFDDTYRRVADQVELRSDDTVEWVYSIPSVPGRYETGVILLRKDISWVDIRKRRDYIDNGKPAIYGTINGLPVGTYRIVITDIATSSILAQLEVQIYDPLPTE